MENKHKKMLDLLNTLEEKNEVPKILLHTCCAPCSTTVLSYLANYFEVTVFYYNPNISPYEEYLKRKEEQKRLLSVFPSKYKISFLDCDYDGKEFDSISFGLEEEPERGKRCYKCYKLRLEKTAIIANELNFDYFGTSLTVSPYKNSVWLNEIGKELEQKYNIKFLESDFKKEQGYLKSINYSQEYNLYRQNYCGCKYSKRDYLKKNEEKKTMGKKEEIKENKSYLEKGLPIFLENDIKALKEGIKNKVSYVDCLINEVQGSANSAYVDGIITEEQIDYIFDKYVYGDWRNIDD